MNESKKMTAPFPYFGGKRRAATLVWERFGEVFTYIEPFAGSLAVLLQKDPMPREIVNDLDGFVVNFWRAVKFDPEQTAFWADMPTCHLTLSAVRKYLGKRLPMLEELAEEPDAYDTRLAGYWAWCVSNSIGMPSLTNKSDMPALYPGETGRGVGAQRKNVPTGKQPIILWNSSGRGVAAQRNYLPQGERPHIEKGDSGVGVQTQKKELPGGARPILNHGGGGIGVETNRIKIPQGKRPHIDRNPVGQGVSAQRKEIPHINFNQGGQGINAQRRIFSTNNNPYTGDRLNHWFSQLATRLARTYILCKDWSDIFSPTLTGLVQGKTETVGVFFDPPYATKGRKKDLYRVDSMSIAAQVQAKAIELGANPHIRVCVAGYIDDYEPFPSDWECVLWTKDGIRMGGQSKQAYRREEALWFSPHCLHPNRATLATSQSETQMLLL